MGMSASQARYLNLTARRNNNEYEAQQVAEQKTLLAMQMDAVARDYTQKVSNRELLFVQMDPSANSQSTTRLTYEKITSTNPFSGLGMRIVDTSGSVVVPNDPGNIDELIQKATEEYQKAISNNCFTKTTTNADGTTSSLTYSGQNFMSSYFSGLGTDTFQNNPILDKDGNIVDAEEFKKQIQNLDAPSFHEFWTKNNYSFQKGNILNEQRAYTEDDAAAKSKYEQNVAKLNNMRNDSYKADLNCLDADYLEKKLRSGEWTLQKQNPNADGNGDWISSVWQAESRISDALDKSDDTEAEAEYQQQSAFFQSHDKKLELRLKQLDTEHSAIQTEMDSVKKVVDKNVESTFKTFG